ncbi:MAG: DUF933 domain-containing protein [Candidatus Methylomirabilales bacterium]
MTQIALIGLPFAGKTTLFRLLTGGGETLVGRGQLAAPVGTARVADPRLEALAELFRPAKATPIAVTCQDLPAFSRGSHPEAMERQLVAALREVDLLLHVVRSFTNPWVPHVEGTVDPVRDVNAFETFCLVNDLFVVEKRISRIEEGRKRGKQDQGDRELDLLRRSQAWLEAEKPLRECALSEEESRILKGYALLTLKPVLILLNVGEESLGAPIPAALAHLRVKTDADLIVCPVQIEWELSQLDPQEAAVFAGALGVRERTSTRLLHQCLHLLDLMTFFTVGEEEVRAWPLPRGEGILRAAGTVHTDMERGFIKAEVIACELLVSAGSLANARRQGILRLEGRDYIVQDGDVITIRFNP